MDTHELLASSNTHGVFLTLDCIEWFVDLDTKKIGALVLGELQNMSLGKNEEDKMSKKVTNGYMTCPLLSSYHSKIFVGSVFSFILPT